MVTEENANRRQKEKGKSVMQITVTKEEAKEIISGKAERLNTGVEKLSSLVNEEKWDEAIKILKAFSSLTKQLESNIAEVNEGK
jgi:hypothetical protein